MYCCPLKDVMCLYEQFCQSLCISTLCALVLQGARTDLPLTISVKVLPLFSLLAKECRVRGFYVIHLLANLLIYFLFCSLLSFLFHVFLSTLNFIAILFSKRQLMHSLGYDSYISEMHKRPIPNTQEALWHFYFSSTECLLKTSLVFVPDCVL